MRSLTVGLVAIALPSWPSLAKYSVLFCFLKLVLQLFPSTFLAEVEYTLSSTISDFKVNLLIQWQKRRANILLLDASPKACLS